MTSTNVVSLKGVINVMVMGVIALVTDIGDYRAIAEVGIWVVGMISIAAVLRSDVRDLKKWKKDHETEVDEYKSRHSDIHSALAENLREIKTLVQEQQRRILFLENERRSKRQ